MNLALAYLRCCSDCSLTILLPFPTQKYNKSPSQIHYKTRNRIAEKLSVGPFVPKFSTTAWAPWASENKRGGPAYSGFHVIRIMYKSTKHNAVEQHKHITIMTPSTVMKHNLTFRRSSASFNTLLATISSSFL